MDGVSLEEVADPLGRSDHRLILDQEISRILDDGLEEEKLYFVEKTHYYSPCNTGKDQAHNVGNERGDTDIMIYDTSSDSITLKEVKRARDVPASLSYEERKDRFNVIDDAHDQISDFEEMLNTINVSWNVDLELEESEVLVWSDVFDGSVAPDVPAYRGGHICTSEAYNRAMDSEAFEALNDSAYNGELLLKGRRIREIDQ